MDITGFLTLNIELLQLSCVSRTEPEVSYLFRVIIALAAVVVFFCLYLLSRVLGPLLKIQPWDHKKVFNSAGQVWQTLYISILLVALLPFQCYRHPNGKSSMRAYAQTVCGEDSHDAMVGIGATFTVVYGVGFFTLCLFANVMAPRLSSSKASFLLYFRFLVFRFRVDRWWWGSVLMIRSFLIALVPVVNPDSGYAQLCMMVVIAAAFLIAQSQVQPWKTAALNYTDNMVLCVLIVVAGASSGFLDPPSAAPEGFATIIACAFILVGLFLFAAIAIGGLQAIATSRNPVAQQNQERQQNEKLAHSLVVTLMQVAKLSELDIAQTFRVLGPFDRRAVKTFCDMMKNEVFEQNGEGESPTLRDIWGSVTGTGGVRPVMLRTSSSKIRAGPRQTRASESAASSDLPERAGRGSAPPDEAEDVRSQVSF